MAITKLNANMINADPSWTSGKLPMHSVITTDQEIPINYILPIDTSGGSVTLTLPLVLQEGDRFTIIDYNDNFDVNNLIILRNGHNIEGVSDDLTINTKGLDITLFYINATIGLKGLL